MSFDRLSKTLPALSPTGRNALSEATQTCSASAAAKAATVLLGCYRKGDAADPQTYVTGIAAVLSHYSDAIVRGVVSPTDGLPARLKFLPTIAEVREACDQAVEKSEGPARRERERQAVIAETMARRERPIADDERARVAARAEKLAAEMRERSALDNAIDGMSRDQQLEQQRLNTKRLHDQEWAQLGVYAPPKISVALAKSLGTLNQYLPKDEEEAA